MGDVAACSTDSAASQYSKTPLHDASQKTHLHLRCTADRLLEGRREIVDEDEHRWRLRHMHPSAVGRGGLAPCAGRSCRLIDLLMCMREAT